MGETEYVQWRSIDGNEGYPFCHHARKKWFIRLRFSFFRRYLEGPDFLDLTNHKIPSQPFFRYIPFLPIGLKAAEDVTIIFIEHGGRSLEKDIKTNKIR